MAAHADGMKLFIDSFSKDIPITKEQAREAVDYVTANMKRNIESNPYTSREEKDDEIHRNEMLLNSLKSLTGL